MMKILICALFFHFALSTHQIFPLDGVSYLDNINSEPYPYKEPLKAKPILYNEKETKNDPKIYIEPKRSTNRRLFDNFDIKNVWNNKKINKRKALPKIVKYGGILGSDRNFRLNMRQLNDLNDSKVYDISKIVTPNNVITYPEEGLIKNNLNGSNDNITLDYRPLTDDSEATPIDESTKTDEKNDKNDEISNIGVPINENSELTYGKGLKSHIEPNYNVLWNQDDQKNIDQRLLVNANHDSYDYPFGVNSDLNTMNNKYNEHLLNPKNRPEYLNMNKYESGIHIPGINYLENFGYKNVDNENKEKTMESQVPSLIDKEKDNTTPLSELRDSFDQHDQSVSTPMSELHTITYPTREQAQNTELNNTEEDNLFQKLIHMSSTFPPYIESSSILTTEAVENSEWLGENYEDNNFKVEDNVSGLFFKDTSDLDLTSSSQKPLPTNKIGSHKEDSAKEHIMANAIERPNMEQVIGMLKEHEIPDDSNDRSEQLFLDIINRNTTFENLYEMGAETAKVLEKLNVVGNSDSQKIADIVSDAKNKPNEQPINFISATIKPKNNVNKTEEMYDFENKGEILDGETNYNITDFVKYSRSNNNKEGIIQTEDGSDNINSFENEQLTYSPKEIHSKDHLVSANHQINDDKKDQLQKLCKLARLHLKALRKFVAKKYGLNTKTAEENDLITIVHIMGLLHKARETDTPVEEIVNYFLNNLRKMGELRKLVCKGIPESNQKTDDKDEIDNTNDILTHFDQYLFKTNKELPNQLRSRQNVYQSFLPHNSVLEDLNLYANQPYLTEYLNENNAYKLNQNLYPVQNDHVRDDNLVNGNLPVSQHGLSDKNIGMPMYQNASVNRTMPILEDNDTVPNTESNFSPLKVESHTDIPVPEYVEDINSEAHIVPPPQKDNIPELVESSELENYDIAPDYKDYNNEIVFSDSQIDNINLNLCPNPHSNLVPCVTESVKQNEENVNSNLQINYASNANQNEVMYSVIPIEYIDRFSKDQPGYIDIFQYIIPSGPGQLINVKESSNDFKPKLDNSDLYTILQYNQIPQNIGNIYEKPVYRNENVNKDDADYMNNLGKYMDKIKQQIKYTKENVNGYQPPYTDSMKQKHQKINEKFNQSTYYNLYPKNNFNFKDNRKTESVNDYDYDYVDKLIQHNFPKYHFYVENKIKNTYFGKPEDIKNTKYLNDKENNFHDPLEANEMGYSVNEKILPNFAFKYDHLPASRIIKTLWEEILKLTVSKTPLPTLATPVEDKEIVVDEITEKPVDQQNVISTTKLNYDFDKTLAEFSSTTTKPKSHIYEGASGEAYEELLEKIKQYHLDETNSVNFTSDMETGKKFNKSPENHFDVYLNDKKLNFWPHFPNKIDNNKAPHSIRIKGDIKKVDLESLVTVAYEQVSTESEIPLTEELKLLLEIRNKVDIVIVTNVIWQEILRLRQQEVSEEKIGKYVYKLVTMDIPNVFMDSQKCRTDLFHYLTYLIRKSNDLFQHHHT